MPPGPICNSHLLLKQKVRPNLILDVDYRAVSQEQWHLLLNIYGGGPIIARQEKSIYSKVPIYQNASEYSQRAGGGTSKSSQSGSSNSKSDRISEKNNLFAANRIRKNKKQSQTSQIQQTPRSTVSEDGKSEELKEGDTSIQNYHKMGNLTSIVSNLKYMA